MPLSNSQYDEIMRMYERKRVDNQHILQRRKELVYEKANGYSDIEDAIAAVSISQSKKLLRGEEGALDELHELIEDLSAQKKKLLIAAGFPENYLEPVYDCKDCHDTGYDVETGEKCHCLRQAIIELLYDQSNIREMLEAENFNNLSYEYYEGDDLKRFRHAEQTCRNFINNFNSDYHNLLFYGTVGTGKSFLSACVAKELLEKGHPVLYFSSTALFEALSSASFDYKNKGEAKGFYKDLYECDLLIIDDLGTELTNQFVSAQLFACLNERHIRKKATVISTNLTMENIRDRYSERVFSRIVSNYEMCKLTGPDIRIYKKRNMVGK